MKAILLICTVLIQGAFAQEYARVPTAEERQNDSRYYRLPEFKPVDIVVNGEINSEKAKDIDETKWNKDIHLENLQTLRLDNFDVLKDQITTEKAEIIVPFGIDVRFEDKSSPISRNGTINAEGILKMTILDGMPNDIEIRKYHDSRRSEQAARNAGHTNQYDNQFVFHAIRGPLLNHLREEPLLGQLRSLVLEKGTDKIKKKLNEFKKEVEEGF